jgi:hypothetical protein
LKVKGPGETNGLNPAIFSQAPRTPDPFSSKSKLLAKKGKLRKKSQNLGTKLRVKKDKIIDNADDKI